MDIPTIAVTTKSTDKFETAKKWLDELSGKPILAMDFEAAVKYTEADRKKLQELIDNTSTDYIEKRSAEAVLSATALGHPAHSKVTHFSVAWAVDESYVIIMDSDEVTDLVMDFITTTEVKQVWHRAAYDFKHVYYHTGKFPKNYEDSQIFAKTVFNHVETHKARTGLKELAGSVYGSWGEATDKEDFFTLENMRDPKMLTYAGIDSCATLWVWNRLVENFQEPGEVYPDTTEDYTPWEQLPAPTPKGAHYPEAHFYHYTAKWLIKDTVKIMMNGLPIDLEEVRKLELVLVDVLEDVAKRIADNPTVTRFLEHRYERMKKAYIKERKSKLKNALAFSKPFNSKNAVHRGYFMDVFSERVGLSKPEDKLPQGCSKWSVKLIRKLSSRFPPLKRLVAHEITSDNPTAQEAMFRLAEDAARRHNAKYLEQIKCPNLEYPAFSPASPIQKQEIFAWLGYQSDKKSAKTGNDSWDREQIEQLNKTATDDDVIAFTQALIDYSFAAIVKNTFIKGFYEFTIDGVLHGEYELLGAKSGRYTSKEP